VRACAPSPPDRWARPVGALPRSSARPRVSARRPHPLAPLPIACPCSCATALWAPPASPPSFNRPPEWTTSMHAETAAPTSPLQVKPPPRHPLKPMHLPTSPLPHSFHLSALTRATRGRFPCSLELPRRQASYAQILPPQGLPVVPGHDLPLPALHPR
jgi:hypothetical protein